MLNKHNLAIASLASKDQSRYTMNGIHVTPGYTEVTDGHILMRVTTPAEVKADGFPVWDGFQAGDDFKPFILGSDDAQRIAKALPKKSTIPALTMAAVDASQSNPNGHAVIGVTDLENKQVFSVQKMDGQFPNTDAVMPTKKPILEIGIDARLAVDLLRALVAFRSDADKKRPASVKLSFYDEQSAIKLESTNSDTSQDAVALLMPVRL